MVAHRDAYLPPPNAIVINKANGHAHALTLLATPVAKHSAADLSPSSISPPLSVAWHGASTRIAGLPRTDRQEEPASRSLGGRVAARRTRIRCRSSTAGFLKRDMRPNSSVTTMHGFSRNCTCFDKVREIAYREVRDAKRAGKSVSEFQTRTSRR